MDWMNRYLELYETAARDRHWTIQRESVMIWSLMAQDVPMTLFGKPFTVTFSWPEGLPLGLPGEAELRAYAHAELAKLDGER